MKLISKCSTAFSPGDLKKLLAKKYIPAKLLSHVNLNDIGSNKETYHIEIEAEDVSYQPGDSIGIIPENKKEIVEKIIANYWHRRFIQY